MSAARTAVRVFVTVSGQGRTWRSVEALDRAIAHREPYPATPPRSGRGVTVAQRDEAGLRVVRLVPPASRGTLVAVAGGATVFGPVPQHWTMWRTLAIRSRRTVAAVLHPLAPQGTAATVVPAVARIAEEAEGPVALLGDSAGGGIVLAAALLLRERGLRPPLLLSAPWLDLTMRQPWILERDPWLAVPGLAHAADLWRGDLPVEHPLVSPLLADLDGLGPIVAASGTRDVLHRDALRLEARVPLRAPQDGTRENPVRLLIGQGLLHDYPLQPIPEARPALRAFVDALR